MPSGATSSASVFMRCHGGQILILPPGHHRQRAGVDRCRYPPALLDILLAANISIAVIMLLTTLYVKTPLEFSIFPSLLWRPRWADWCSNVATTRLILTRAGIDGMMAAGGVVRSFGEFVAGDQVVVGTGDLRDHRV